MFNRSKKKKKAEAKKKAQAQAARSKKTNQERLEQEPLEQKQAELTLTAQEIEQDELDRDMDGITYELDDQDCDFDNQNDPIETESEIDNVDESEIDNIERDSDLAEEAQLESEVVDNEPAVAALEGESENSQLDQSARILENIEFLIALHEDNVESTSHSQNLSGFDAAFAEAINGQTADIESFFLAQNDSFIQLFETKIDPRFEQVEKQLKQISGKVNQSLKSAKNNKHSPATADSELVETIEKQQVKFDELFEFVTSHFDERTGEIVSSLQSSGQPTADIGSFKDDFNERFQALDQRLQKIASAIEGQQQLIEAQTHRIAEHVSVSVSEIADATTTNVDSTSNSSSSENHDDTESHWGRQKAAMLSKYGIDPEHRPSMEIPTPEPEIELDPAIVAVPDEGLHDLHDLQNSINEMSAEDAEHIDQLKDDLTSKLRDAEVELSIQRAKLSRLNAELDQKKTELDRRETKIDDKYEDFANASVTSGPGLLERLKRHLNAKDRKNLDRL